MKNKKEYCRTFAKYFPKIKGDNSHIAPKSYATHDEAIYYKNKEGDIALINLENDIECQKMYKSLKGKE